MKITFVLPPLSASGGIRVIAIHAAHLSDMGHEVRLVSVQPRQPGLRAQLRSLRRGHGLIPRREAGKPFADLAALDLVVLPHSGPVTDRDLPDADVVVATWWETAPWVARLSPAKGAKAYYMQDYGAPGQEFERIMPTWRLPMHIITISEWLAGLVREECPGKAVTLVPNAVDTALFDAPPRGRRAVPRVGFAYRTLPSKGMDTANAAIAIARRQLPELEVLVFGPERGSDAPPLPEGTEYHTRPPDAELPGLYAACDAWLFPSRLEGYGLPIIEAMACRTPVIGTTAGAAPELITPERGFLVPVGEPEEMAEAIVTLARLPEAEWRAMSEACHAAMQAYHWADAARKFEAGLRAAIAESRS